MRFSGESDFVQFFVVVTKLLFQKSHKGVCCFNSTLKSLNFKLWTTCQLINKFKVANITVLVKSVVFVHPKMHQTQNLFLLEPLLRNAALLKSAFEKTQRNFQKDFVSLRFTTGFAQKFRVFFTENWSSFALL